MRDINNFDLLFFITPTNKNATKVDYYNFDEKFCKSQVNRQMPEMLKIGVRSRISRIGPMYHLVVADGALFWLLVLAGFWFVGGGGGGMGGGGH